jgi:hypothetical protein
MTPLPTQLAALFAALLLLSPTVYGCVIFQARWDKENGIDTPITMSGTLVSRQWATVCTLTHSMGVGNPIGEYAFDCATGYSLIWTFITDGELDKIWRFIPLTTGSSTLR